MPSSLRWRRSPTAATAPSRAAISPASRSDPSTTTAGARTIPTTCIPHRQRRELRGLRLFAAWLNHFDTKQRNSLDIYSGEEGAGHVVHYLIDFASTLGAGATGPRRATGGSTPWICRPSSAGGWPWACTRAPGIAAGAPRAWTSSATSRERGVRSSRLCAAPAQQRLRRVHGPRRLLGGQDHLGLHGRAARRDLRRGALPRSGRRRPPWPASSASGGDIIARRCFDRVPPLDFFRVVNGELLGQDLGADRGVYPADGTRYRVRLEKVDAEHRAIATGEWREVALPRVDLAGCCEPAPGAAPAFVAARWQLDRGEGFGPVGERLRLATQRRGGGARALAAGRAGPASPGEGADVDSQPEAQRPRSRPRPLRRGARRRGRGRPAARAERLPAAGRLLHHEAGARGAHPQLAARRRAEVLHVRGAGPAAPALRAALRAARPRDSAAGACSTR